MYTVVQTVHTVHMGTGHVQVWGMGDIGHWGHMALGALVNSIIGGTNAFIVHYE